MATSNGSAMVKVMDGMLLQEDNLHVCYENGFCK